MRTRSPASPLGVGDFCRVFGYHDPNVATVDQLLFTSLLRNPALEPPGGSSSSYSCRISEVAVPWRVLSFGSIHDRSCTPRLTIETSGNPTNGNDFFGGSTTGFRPAQALAARLWPTRHPSCLGRWTNTDNFQTSPWPGVRTWTSTFSRRNQKKPCRMLPSSLNLRNTKRLTVLARCEAAAPDHLRDDLGGNRI